MSAEKLLRIGVIGCDGTSIAERPQKATAKHSAPEYLRSDNRQEFIETGVPRWLAQ